MDMNAVHAALAALAHKPVRSVTRIGKGANSRVYRLVCEDGSQYVAKRYFQRGNREVDGLDVEFSSLRFLWDNGERCVPQPIAADRRNQIALYDYVEGDEIDSRTVSGPDIEQLVSFAGRLKRLSGSEQADQLPRAAEACFSFEALHDNIFQRLERLNEVQSGYESTASLRRFLSDEFVPALNVVVKRAMAEMAEAAWKAELPPSALTLSPSDFGFHNAVRRLNGSIAFLDFEYFGKDDPAKMIADVVLHPGMELSDSIKRSYVERMLERFGADRGLPDRLTFSYPLFGLKWCMILLNEFVPKFLERREFATELGANREQVRMRQLEKARRMLGRTVSELECFPYRAKCV